MESIKIFNPRYLLRHGSAEMMAAAAAGDIALLRTGPIGAGVKSDKLGNTGAAFGAAKGKVFRLVECTDEEVAEYEALYQSAQG